MLRTTMILIVLALLALASVPAMAVDWVLDGSYSATSMNAYLGTGYPPEVWYTNFSATQDMPSWTNFTGTAIPDVRVKYHISEFNYGAGNFGLGLWLGATPSASTGLFGAMSGAWYSLQTVGLGANTSYANQYPFAYDNNNYSWQDNEFDVDMQVVTSGGATTVTAAVTNTSLNNPNNPGHITVVATFDATSSVAAWAGNSKLAAFEYGPNYGYNATAYGQEVSNIQFYRAAAVPEPGSLMMLGMGAVGLAGLLKRRSR